MGTLVSSTNTIAQLIESSLYWLFLLVQLQTYKLIHLYFYGGEAGTKISV